MSQETVDAVHGKFFTEFPGDAERRVQIAELRAKLDGVITRALRAKKAAGYAEVQELADCVRTLAEAVTLLLQPREVGP